MDCLFCKIVEKNLPADVVYEDEKVVAFNDIDPKAPIHILVIPRKHINTLNDISDEDTELMGYLLQTAKKLAKEHNIDKKGYRTLINCNSAGGQAVYHIHLHLLGGRTMQWPPG